jgi:hypothetical protein
LGLLWREPPPEPEDATVLTAGRSDACHPRHARCAMRGSGRLHSSHPLRCALWPGHWQVGMGIARASIEWERLNLRRRCPDDSVAFWIECDGGDRRPVAGLPTPAPRVAFPRPLGDRVASGERGSVLTGMTLCRSNIADPAVRVLVVVPPHEAHRPLPCGIGVGGSRASLTSIGVGI